MTLDAISAGVQVLVDANILIYARRGMSFQWEVWSLDILGAKL